MKVMTFNVKHKYLEDFLCLFKKRFFNVVEFIKEENPDILGMQEITKNGKKYLEKQLSEYHIIGESRHSFFLSNEYNPILIKKKYNIASTITYSLSENKNKLGFKTKYDGFPRICVIAHIKDKKNKYCIINTHIDNSCSNNKKRLLEILERIIKEEINKDEYLIIMGDFHMSMKNNNLKNI